MESQTKIPRVFNVETKPSYVQMRMSFIGKSATSKIIRLQSDTIVLRAMRKFSKLVKEPVRKLRFSSEGIEVVGNELARDMEGADILVESRRRNGIL